MNGFNKVSTTSERLKLAMNIAQKKQIDLVKETGINRSAISRYLSGQYEPKQTAVYKLAKCLNVSEMWLWGYDVPIDRPAEQKENDELVDIVDRLQTDEEFKNVVFAINKFDPDKLKSLMNLLDL